MVYDLHVRDNCWVKSRIAARILIRGHYGRLVPRDRRLAARLARDPGLSDRLLGQALASICARNGNDYHAVLRGTLASKS